MQVSNHKVDGEIKPTATYSVPACQTARPPRGKWRRRGRHSAAQLLEPTESRDGTGAAADTGKVGPWMRIHLLRRALFK